MNPSKLAPVGLAILGALAILGLVLLAGLGRQVPDVLPYLALSASSALGGIALPRQSVAVEVEQPQPPPPVLPPNLQALAAPQEAAA